MLYNVDQIFERTTEFQSEGSLLIRKQGRFNQYKTFPEGK